MTIPSIITPMNFSLARDAICQLLANERDAQIALAEGSEAGENWISQNIDFTIFPKRFRFPDAADMPCVFVYFNEMLFPESEQDIYCNSALATLRVEYYATGKSESGINANGEPFEKTADENAEDRLNYLTAQIYKILCNETNVRKGTNNLVVHSLIKKWERILSPENNNSAETVLGAAFTFELGFEEPTYYAQTHEIQEFYISLDIQDEFIDPLVRVLLDS